jgi:kumamolisin
MRADPSDWTAVEAFAQEFGLTVSNEKPDARLLHVGGSLAQIGKAFGVEIQQRVDAQGRSYLSYQGSLSIPRPLEGIVEAVLGLDQRPIARPRGAQ